MKSNIVQDKSFNFAVSIIKISRNLAENKKEFVLSKQLLKSGTSIGANIEEAIGGQSRADFYSKMTIAYKEAREVSYWLRLLNASDLINEAEFNELNNNAQELCKIIAAIQKSTKNS